MNSFLVLGQVPGTNIQISFQAWLTILGMLLIVAAKFRPHAQRALRQNQADSLRQPLHASQLHQRAL
ncbi:MAG: hypothetical protein WA843_03605 [Candidatus Saccharimonadales bacterium]